MRLSQGERRYSEFLLDVGEIKVQKNLNDEIELTGDMVLPARTMEECRFLSWLLSVNDEGEKSDLGILQI